MKTNRILPTGVVAAVAVAIGLSVAVPADARDVKGGGGARNNVSSGANRSPAANRDAAVAFARLPEQVRGFGHVKARHLAAARQQWNNLQQQFRGMV